MAGNRGGLLLIPATAWHGCVEDPAQQRLWLTDGHVASSSESMLKLRPRGARQCGVVPPIHAGDSIVWLNQDTDTLNTLQCGITALRTQSGSFAPGPNEVVKG